MVLQAAAIEWAKAGGGNVHGVFWNIHQQFPANASSRPTDRECKQDAKGILENHQAGSLEQGWQRREAEHFHNANPLTPTDGGHGHST